jgi:hypothetical protein
MNSDVIGQDRRQKIYLIAPQFQDTFTFSNAIGWFRHPRRDFYGTHNRIYNCAYVKVKFVDENLAPISGVKVRLVDTSGNGAWTVGKDTSNYLAPDKEEIQTTDANGEIEALVIREDQYCTGAPGGSQPPACDNYKVTTVYAPFEATAGKYGYISINNAPKNYSGVVEEQISILNNQYLEADETTASGYPSKFTIDWDNKKLETDGTGTDQELYDYAEYDWLQNMEYEKPLIDLHTLNTDWTVVIKN